MHLWKTSQISHNQRHLVEALLGKHSPFKQLASSPLTPMLKQSSENTSVRCPRAGQKVMNTGLRLLTSTLYCSILSGN